MKIITGKTATEHVNSEDDRGLHAGIFGSDSYVLNTNNKLQASIESSTTIRINSGDLVHQGCHARIPYSEYDEVTIDAGTTGYKRIDLIVARYEKNAGLESMSLVAIKGQPTASTPIAPDYNHGNILQGASISDMPLYSVTLDGVNIESIETLFTEFNKNNTIGNYIYPVGSIYMSVNNVNPMTLFGGTWEKIEGKFLLSAGNGHTLGETGGRESIDYTPNATIGEHQLTSYEVPHHSHDVYKDNLVAVAPTPGDTIYTTASGTTNVQSGTDHFVPLANMSANYLDIEGTITTSGEFGDSELGGKARPHGHSYTGSEVTFETMPPYLAVNVWKRTA